MMCVRMPEQVHRRESSSSTVHSKDVLLQQGVIAACRHISGEFYILGESDFIHGADDVRQELVSECVRGTFYIV